jgi:hypothetical protein
MMKMMILAPRRAGMTHDAFRRYVLEVHGPLVRGVAEVAADILHYHYNFPVAGARDEAFGHPIAVHLDIVTQGWFASLAAQRRNMERPRYMEMIRPDEHRFADGARAVMHCTHEIEITPGEMTAHKIFYFRRRRAGLSRAAFQSLWRAGVTEAIGGNRVWNDTVCRYVQNHAMAEADHPDGADAKYFDVIDELALRAPGRTAGLRADPALMGAIGGLEQALTEPARTLALVTETVVNIA